MRRKRKCFGLWEEMQKGPTLKRRGACRTRAPKGPEDFFLRKKRTTAALQKDLRWGPLTGK